MAPVLLERETLRKVKQYGDWKARRKSSVDEVRRFFLDGRFEEVLEAALYQSPHASLEEADREFVRKLDEALALLNNFKATAKA